MADKKVSDFTAKTTLSDTDVLPLVDLDSSPVTKKITWANIFAAIVTKFHSLTGKTTLVDADEFLVSDSATSFTGKKVTWANIKYKEAQISYVVSSGTDGGTATSGSFQTRPINTIDFDPGSVISGSIVSNQFSIIAGIYILEALAFCYNVDHNQLRFRNITDSLSFLGMTNYAPAVGATPNNSYIRAKFTIAATKVFELQQQVETTRANDGFGTPGAFGNNEIYCIIKIKRIG